MVHDYVSNSDDNSEEELIRTPSPSAKEAPAPPESTLSYRFRESPKPRGQNNTAGQDDQTIVVMVPPPERPWEYKPFEGGTIVDKILEEINESNGEAWYQVEFEDGKQDKILLSNLLKLRNGSNALDLFNHDDNEEEEEKSNPEKEKQQHQSSTEPGMSSSAGKRPRRKAQPPGFVHHASVDFGSEEGDSTDQSIIKKRRLGKDRVSLLSNTSTRQSSRVGSRVSSRNMENGDKEGDENSSDSEPEPRRRGGNLSRRAHSSATHNIGRITRSTGQPLIKLRHVLRKKGEDEEIDELAEEGQAESDDSDILYVQKYTKNKNNEKTRRQSLSKGKRGRPRKVVDESSSSSPDEAPTRRSGRENKASKSMRERDMDEEMFADEVAPKNAPKVISIREVYQPLPKDSQFHYVHNQICDTCQGAGKNSNKGLSELIYCQGCSTSIHKACLGYRSQREHMVTKVGPDNFVMQCRRCIGLAIKKDSSAPRLDICQGCGEPGVSCAAFSSRKTAKQEEKLREENDGTDPVTKVSDKLINNSDNILFRCVSCRRGYHLEHLPPLTESFHTPEDVADLRDERLAEYKAAWECKECREMVSKVQTLVAWRPIVGESYEKGQTIDMFREDEKEYLVKWEEESYFKCSWMPGAWVWGVTAATMRKAFVKREEASGDALPKWTFEEAIPDEYLRMEIVFDVSYRKGFRSISEASDKASISKVDEVLVKFHGLGYDEAVWAEPPSPDETDRWNNFVVAYNEYLVGKYFKQPSAATMKERIDVFCSLDFESKIECKEQPSAMTGGEMMPYQMEGLNWLLYNFHQQKNVILADEMGLGKTIQCIAMIASLAKDNPECWPFLVVVPNSTCPNWRREIKTWAPSLRVVAYYGSKHARDMAMEYELFPKNCTDMRAHIVVTSYEAPVDDHSRSFFKRIKWAGMIVDEGQRLKNDENLLYGALKALKTPFQVLLTGTPLQNNKRELFNLLQFLDSSINAAKLDEKYEILTKENLPELHDLIRPFFLRRTKLQVLKFLPPMAQVILPVTMSLVQKKLYKSILAKNPDLIKSIFGQSKAVLRSTERGNLNNILMQLRKCLCHPFVYNNAIEETNVNLADSHRNLIDASSKFQLLEIMLPKLRERGHRVLLFSQFLNQLDLIEEFLDSLGLRYGRLDGSIGTLEKQKRIDAFNAPDSELFAFLLSTRAGGVGINLATADTVIIMDPDFNPHQDIQALSRAHRIGQKKKVLVFQLMTKDSAEEKIVQIGRKKMALDQALIESMGAEDDAGVDLESILKHGAEALFNDDDRNDIHYDSASVDKLLDRTQVESTDADQEKTAESQFSYARVWANDKGTLTEDIGDVDTEPATPNPSVWHKILKQREEDAAREAAKHMQTFGRGKRARNNVVYEKLDDEPGSTPQRRRQKRPDETHSDNDFSAVDSDGEDESEGDATDPGDLENPTKGKKAKSFSVKKQRSITKTSIQSGQTQKTSSVETPSKRSSGVKKTLPVATNRANKMSKRVAKSSNSVRNTPVPRNITESSVQRQPSSGQGTVQKYSVQAKKLAKQVDTAALLVQKSVKKQLPEDSHPRVSAKQKSRREVVKSSAKIPIERPSNLPFSSANHSIPDPAVISAKRRVFIRKPGPRPKANISEQSVNSSLPTQAPSKMLPPSTSPPPSHKSLLSQGLGAPAETRHDYLNPQNRNSANPQFLSHRSRTCEGTDRPQAILDLQFNLDREVESIRESSLLQTTPYPKIPFSHDTEMEDSENGINWPHPYPYPYLLQIASQGSLDADRAQGWPTRASCRASFRTINYRRWPALPTKMGRAKT
ncbi:hypothetical protein B7494_g1003 [Chlorociboria aeruginascens]|nr:hypothetical protein B7494_g1003 [Chlorociboria aeruginascens]